MDKERIIEVARNTGTSIKDKARYAAYAAGGFSGVFFSVDGVMSGNKVEAASGVVIAATTSVEIALQFIHQKTKKGKAQNNSDSNS